MFANHLRQVARSPRRRPSAMKLFVELLEDRTLPAGLFYWASGERVELQKQTDQYAIKVIDSNPEQLLASLTASSGALAGLTIKDQLAPEVWHLEASSPTPINTSTFSVPGVAWLTTGFVNPTSNAKVLVIDEVIVGLKPGVSPGQFFSTLGGTVGDFEYRPLTGTPDQFVLTLHGRTGEATLAVANGLSKDNRVDFAAPNAFQNFQQYFTPNDPLFPQQWHLNNTGSQVPDAIAGADVKAVNAWNLSTGTGVTIAVIDSGMETPTPTSPPTCSETPASSAGHPASMTTATAGSMTSPAGALSTTAPTKV